MLRYVSIATRERDVQCICYTLGRSSQTCRATASIPLPHYRQIVGFNLCQNGFRCDASICAEVRSVSIVCLEMYKAASK